MKPPESLYKQALKTLDKKPFRFHHCHILKNYKLLSCENLIMYKNICLECGITHGSAPPPLSDFINFRSAANRATRGAAGETARSRRKKMHAGRPSFPSGYHISWIQYHHQLESSHHTVHLSLTPRNGLVTAKDVKTDARII